MMTFFIFFFGIAGLLLGDHKNKIMEFAFFLLIIKIAMKLGIF